jgi:hypothetical protein
MIGFDLAVEALGGVDIGLDDDLVPSLEPA